MIVLSGTGETKDEIGKPILYNGNETVAAGGDVIIFKPLDGVNSEYILFQLYSRRSLAFRYVNGKGDIIVHIYPKNLGNSVVSMIDEEKQSVVVERIKETIKKVDAATQKLKQDIEVLHELRTQLVSDVVTGQIDVRGIEVPDFEYVGEDADGESEENVVSSEGEQDEE